MQSYTITLTGKMPLLMHADNIEWADQMSEWKDNAVNKKGSKAGDDRSPALDGRSLRWPSGRWFRRWFGTWLCLFCDRLSIRSHRHFTCHRCARYQ